MHRGARNRKHHAGSGHVAGGRVGKRIGIVAGTVLIACTVPGVLLAKGKSPKLPVEAKSTATVKPNFTGAGKAACKGGRTAVAGGFRTPGFSVDGMDPNPQAMIQTGSIRAGKRWKGRAVAIEGVAGGKLDVYAYCSSDFDLKTRKKRVVAPVGNAPVTDTVRCKGARERLVSAGVWAKPNGDGIPNEAVILTSVRKGKGRWRFVLLNTSNSPLTIDYAAYCAPKKQVPKLKQVKKSRPFSSKDEQRLKVNCPKGTRILNGGFDAPLTADTTVLPTSNYRSGKRGWTIAGARVGDPGSAEVTAYGYCYRA